MSPWKSEAQKRKFGQLLNEKKITKKVSKEWSDSTGKAKLPERIGPKRPKSIDDLRKLGKK